MEGGRTVPEQPAGTSGETRPGARREPAVLACVAAVLLAYAWLASADLWQMGAAEPRQAYYNLLVDGFRAGQLHLKTTVPEGLRRLPNPYDPVANEPYRGALHDASYHEGRIYLYFGVTPALVLFLPYAVLTGEYLSHGQAVLIFCGAGFLASTVLLLAVRRRYFPEAREGLVLLGVVALGGVSGVPVLLGRPDVWEVPIACAYAAVMLALLGVWRALHDEVRPVRWLVAASCAYGLAVGARPSVLPGAVILLVPVLWAWRGGRRGAAVRLLVAAVVPLTLCGLGLLAYNHARFGRWTEFGQTYQLAGIEVARHRLFGPGYAATNFRIYFLQPLRWTTDFPFAHGVTVPALPAGHLGVEGAFGALVNLPFLLLAGGAVVAWRRGGAERARLRWFGAAVAVLFVTGAGVLLLFAGACDRYQVEFLPALALLAACGLLEWERRSRGGALVGVVGGGLLAVSVAVSWCASHKSGPESCTTEGNRLVSEGRFAEAARRYEVALRVDQDFAPAHHGLGLALGNLGRREEAVGHHRAALRVKPDFPEARNALGVALLGLGRAAEAEVEFAEAGRLAPAMAEAQYGRALALFRLDRRAEGIAALEEALRRRPDFAAARERLQRERGGTR